MKHIKHGVEKIVHKPYNIPEFLVALNKPELKTIHVTIGHDS